MDFNLDPDQQAFVDSVRRFASEQLAPGALARAHSPGFPRDVARLMAKQGLLGIAFDEADGGQGGSLLDAVLAIQEVALHCPRSADVVQAGNFGPIRTFVEYASAQQKSRWLPGLLSGEVVISLGMSEPEAGSAVTELKTSARVEGEQVVVNGTKVFSTHSPDADVFLVYVRFGPGVDGIGSVLVERNTPGFTVGKPSAFMSGEEWSELHFVDCRIPNANILLGEGGFRKQIAGFNVERLGNASRSLALGRYCFEQARAYATTRRQFGRELCEFQGLQWKFADMKLKLELAQLALYKAVVEQGPDGLPTAQGTAMAKLACNQAGWEVSNDALQVMGALGYSQESLVEYCVRRTRGWMIAGGSIEMLKNRIAEGVFERSFPQRPGR
ncbi:acyl-CoA dehydrogenase family protein [Ramlibacter albus]|uniref:Acyl-CoA dehydrogenase family protein n=1 Tax=Ramlibacter albus TaxID=2079448 RepID=A0A923MBQ0_9BURK|nr:acyl-CoA dehydrogenase family protein [Ramlibacter albus]MBC5767862.1 acyl-CoA dehydrogenase family protein [Ramlibacter albus]